MHNFFEIKHKHNCFLLGPIQSSSTTTTELHAYGHCSIIVGSGFSHPYAVLAAAVVLNLYCTYANNSQLLVQLTPRWYIPSTLMDEKSFANKKEMKVIHSFIPLCLFPLYSTFKESEQIRRRDLKCDKEIILESN